MTRLFVSLIFLMFLGACKPTENYTSLSETDAEGRSELNIAIARPLDSNQVALLNALTKGTSITLGQLEKGGGYLNAGVTAPVKYNNLKGSNVRVRSRYSSRPNYNSNFGYDVYRGMKIGDRVFIFKQVAQPGNSVIDKWHLFSWVAGTILNDPIARKYTAPVEQVRYALDTKIYEPRKIAAMNKFLDQAEFAARFIPGYAGAENAFLGETTSDRVLGVLQIAGDIATLGVGSSVKVVARTAQVVTLSAASARVAVAGYRYSNGSATSADGIDAFLATLEAGISAVSIVKIKLSGAKAFVNNADEAALIGKQLGRSADDVLESGISKAELEKLVGDIPELRALKNAPSSSSGKNAIADSADDTLARRLNSIDCPTGLGLTSGLDCYTKALQKGEAVRDASGQVVADYFRFKNYNDAMEAAMSWLKKNGSGPVQGKWEIGKLSEKFGYTKPNQLSGVTPDGKNFTLRIESHDLKQVDGIVEAHINVSMGKEGGPHFLFSGQNAEVQAILKQLFP